MTRLPLDTRFATCANCGHANDGAFCSNCGQEHRELHHRLSEFIADAADALVHLDGKSVRTLVPLMTKPGQLSVDYLAGKRASMVAPLRLYLYVSFFFFVLLGTSSQHGATKLVFTEASSAPASATTHRVGWAVAAGSQPASNESEVASLSAEADEIERRHANKHGPRGWLVRQFVAGLRKLAADPERVKAQIMTDFVRVLPKVIFALVPLFALILFALFRRSRPYYVEHLIVALHFHAFIFALLCLNVTISMIHNSPAFDTITALIVFAYAFIAFRRVYGRTFLKTLWRWWLAGALYGTCVAAGTFAAAVVVFIEMS